MCNRKPQLQLTAQSLQGDLITLNLTRPKLSRQNVHTQNVLHQYIPSCFLCNCYCFSHVRNIEGVFFLFFFALVAVSLQNMQKYIPFENTPAP